MLFVACMHFSVYGRVCARDFRVVCACMSTCVEMIGGAMDMGGCMRSSGF